MWAIIGGGGPEKALCRGGLDLVPECQEGGCPCENLRKEHSRREPARAKTLRWGHRGMSQEQHRARNGWRERAVEEGPEGLSGAGQEGFWRTYCIAQGTLLNALC